MKSLRHIIRFIIPKTLKDKRDRIIIIKLLIAFSGILICIATGLFLAYTFWPPASGRDFRLGSTIAGILIGLFSILLRVKYKWSLRSLLVSLIPVEIDQKSRGGKVHGTPAYFQWGCCLVS